MQLAVAVARLNWIAACVSSDDTPELAERIERGALSALRTLAARAAPDVRAFLDDHANLERDVLHDDAPAGVERDAEGGRRAAD